MKNPALDRSRVVWIINGSLSICSDMIQVISGTQGQLFPQAALHLPLGFLNGSVIHRIVRGTVQGQDKELGQNGIHTAWFMFPPLSRFRKRGGPNRENAWLR